MLKTIFPNQQVLFKGFMMNEKTERKEKTEYVKLKFELIRFHSDDIILTSGKDPLDPYELEED